MSQAPYDGGMTYARDLNHEYEALHTAKEDAFWTAYMGLAADADAARTDFQGKEIALQRFLQDPVRLDRTREECKRAKPGDDRVALEGWVRTFEANVIPTPEARALAEEIIGLEGELARARAKMKLGFQPAGKPFEECSSVKLGTMLVAESDEARRKAAFEGLRSIEDHVLAHGFLEVVKARNRLGRMLGGEDYYDWKVRRVEGMSKREIFALLDGLEAKTRDSCKRALESIAKEKGPDATRAWNLRYAVAGDVTKEQDPYFPFSQALERWGRSFAALGIGYRGATMVLDLVDRKGKYENGFMHGPVCAWREEGKFRPARIHFTANAIPGMVGSGKRATETLFHVGGHAAHFANVDMPAPCFAQEFAPTSVAFAEVQSMFLDSLLGDADWQARYARTADGRPMPWDLIEKGIRAQQRFASGGVRGMFTVCYCERAIYEIPDAELTAERVLAGIRATERRLLFSEEGSPRPALSVPHLLAGESSAYYHGYVLALMAVHQTRDFFLARDGHLMDNPRIGPDLRDHYWRPGNSVRFPDFIARLTGKALSADALAQSANRTPDEAVGEAKRRIERAKAIPEWKAPVQLGARIRVVHGHEEVASVAPDRGDFQQAAGAFAGWIDAKSTGG